MPMSFNLVADQIAALYPLILTCAAAANPATLLYSILALTYGAAASAASKHGHVDIARCYVTSAAAHAILGVCHHFHL